MDVILKQTGLSKIRLQLSYNPQGQVIHKAQEIIFISLNQLKVMR